MNETLIPLERVVFSVLRLGLCFTTKQSDGAWRTSWLSLLASGSPI